MVVVRVEATRAHYSPREVQQEANATIRRLEEHGCAVRAVQFVHGSHETIAAFIVYEGEPAQVEAAAAAIPEHLRPRD